MAASSARHKSKNPQGLRPLGFLALGLAEDVALGLLSENPLQSHGYLGFARFGFGWLGLALIGLHGMIWIGRDWLARIESGWLGLSRVGPD